MKLSLVQLSRALHIAFAQHITPYESEKMAAPGIKIASQDAFINGIRAALLARQGKKISFSILKSKIRASSAARTKLDTRYFGNGQNGDFGILRISLPLENQPPSGAATPALTEQESGINTLSKKMTDLDFDTKFLIRTEKSIGRTRAIMALSYLRTLERHISLDALCEIMKIQRAEAKMANI
ncbi:hypothetical protein D9M70_489980 [compost metagenome]